MASKERIQANNGTLQECIETANTLPNGLTRFFETYQSGGKRTVYRYAFYDTYWNDITYNPTYPITCAGVSSSMFRYSGITDTKVDIVFTHANSDYVFANSTKLKTIKKLSVVQSVTFVGWFASCPALENITFDGVIGQNMDFSSCPLTKASLLNIIEHLGTVSTTKTLTIGSTNQAKLTSAEIAVATQKGWTVA